MATLAELERLSALTQRLIPISQFQRGALIRADDWNLLIAAVIELARALLLDSESGIVTDHEHPDEVDIGWLTPRLRELMEQGGLSDPVANRRLVTLERNIHKNKQQIDTILLNINKLRSNVDDVKLNDIGREGDLTILRRRFEAQSDYQDEVLDLRKSLNNIKDNISKALELGERISVNGEIADIQGLFERIGGLETLRENLTGPDGNVLDASSLEIRLAELQTKLVNQDQLDEALEQVRVRPPQDLVDSLKTDLHGFVEGELTDRLAAQQTQYDERYVNTNKLSDELNARDQTLRDQTSASINDLSSQFSNNFVANNTLESRLQSLSSTLSTSLAAKVKTELDSRLDGLQKDLDARFISSQQLNSRLAGFSAELEETIINNMRQEITGKVEAALQQQGKELFVSLDAFMSEITAINKRVEDIREVSTQDINAAVTGLKEQSINKDDFESRLQLQQEQLEATLQGRINEEVNEQVNSMINSSLEDVNSRLDNLDSLENRINTNINNQLDSLRQDVSKISRQTVATELQGIQNNLLTVESQVKSINMRLSTQLNEAVSSAMTGFKQEVESDLKLVQQNITSLDKRLVELNTRTQPIITDTRLDPNQPIILEPRRGELRPLEPSSTMISDFTEIDGIGPVRAKLLTDNNVRYFSDLASMPSDKLATLLRISEAEVKRLQLQQQAAAKLQA